MTQSDFERAADFIRAAVVVEDMHDPLGGALLVQAVRQRAVRRSRHRMLAASAAVGLLVIGTWVAPRLGKSRCLTYRIDGASELGVAGAYLNAPMGNPIGLHFSEGSQVVFEPKARGRVAQMTNTGATMILDEGRARANIVHRDKTDWRVYAGPYVVSVTGTSFDVGYEVSTQTFELDMYSGTVRVTGPGLLKPVEVSNTQHIVLSPSIGQRAEVPGSARLRDPNSAESSETDQSHAAAQSGGTRETSSAEVSGASAPTVNQDQHVKATGQRSSWRVLSARGQHRQIIELAEKQGIGAVTVSATAPDLLALGNAARFSGRFELATKAYRALRERFAGSAEASTSAFFLGSLSESLSPAEAIGWYDRYVAEAATRDVKGVP